MVDIPSFAARIVPHPNCALGSQEIGDFLGVALQVQQYAVLFAALKRTKRWVMSISFIQEDYLINLFDLCNSISCIVSFLSRQSCGSAVRCPFRYAQEN